MNAFELRKKTLLLESDLNRLTLHAECAQLRKVASHSTVARWALALAPLAGLAFALGLCRSSHGAGFRTRAASRQRDGGFNQRRGRKLVHQNGHTV